MLARPLEPTRLVAQRTYLIDKADLHRARNRSAPTTGAPSQEPRQPGSWRRPHGFSPRRRAYDLPPLRTNGAPRHAAGRTKLDHHPGVRRAAGTPAGWQWCGNAQRSSLCGASPCTASRPAFELPARCRCRSVAHAAQDADGEAVRVFLERSVRSADSTSRRARDRGEAASDTRAGGGRSPRRTEVRRRSSRERAAGSSRDRRKPSRIAKGIPAPHQRRLASRDVTWTRTLSAWDAVGRAG